MDDRDRGSFRFREWFRYLSPFSEISRGSEEDPGVPYDRFNESVRSNHRGVGLLSWTSLGKVICGEMTGLRQKG